MDLAAFIYEVHYNSKKRGVWDKNHSFAEVCAILNMDLAKATDAYYHGMPVQEIAEKLIDCCLDIFDYIASNGATCKSDYDSLILNSTDCDLYSLTAIGHKRISTAFIKDFIFEIKLFLTELLETAIMLLRWVRMQGIDEEKLLNERFEIQRRQDVRDGKFGSRYERGGTDRFG